MQHIPSEKDWKAGPPGYEDLSLTFVLMESKWPQSSPPHVLDFNVGFWF